MSIYLLQNQQQTGPYTEDQVRHLLQTAMVTGATLGWKEGMPGWSPISAILPASAPASAPAPPPPPMRPKSPLGLASFVVSLVTAPLWLLLFVVSGALHNAGHASPGFNMIVGFLAIAGLFVNFVALVIGLVAAFKSRPNTLAIIGACLNGFMLIGVLGLIALGIAMLHAGQAS
jgi:hypothetical protein